MPGILGIAHSLAASGRVFRDAVFVGFRNQIGALCGCASAAN